MNNPWQWVFSEIAKTPNDEIPCLRYGWFVKDMTLKSFGVQAGLIILLIALMIPAACAADTAEELGYITAGLAPDANFDALYAYNTVPTTVTFRDHSTGTTPLSYAWEFGDGATSSEQNPRHTYTRKGPYTVKLTVTNYYGSSTETKTNYIWIGMAPNADFTGVPTTGNAPLTVAFTDRSTGYPVAWNWNFGDGQSSSGQNPQHTYWAGGDYTVSLTASNEYGETTAYKNYYIHVMPALKSKFSADPKAGLSPLVVRFSDLSTGSPETWTWYFGDGSTSTGTQNPVHTYTRPGAFDVTLTVTRGLDEDSSTQTITVGGVPAADFVADRTTVSEGTPVNFMDKSINSPVAWEWEFGDGSTSTEQNPTKVYPVKGIYTVTLTAANSNGRDTEKKVNYITVGVPPTADFVTKIPSHQVGSRTQYVRFIDTSIGNPVTWQWDFGDGTNYNGQFPPLHLYNRDGLYTVSLTVTNVFGQDTETKTNLIYVREGPRVDFVADRTRLSVNQYVHFTDLSTMSPNDWQWDFGDGISGTGQNPDHVYRQEGTYTVRLTASDGYTSNTHTKKDYITVVNLPDANFEADKTKGVTPFDVQFTDLSTGNPTGWRWDFGDGTSSIQKNPSHVYTTSGTEMTTRYTVTLTATNANGEDRETKVNYITVSQTPIAQFTVDDRRGKVPFVVTFQDLSLGNPTSWLWDFGDAQTSTLQNPVHTYPFEGAYDVRLTVWNQYGSDTIFKTSSSQQRGTNAPIPLPVFVEVTPQGTLIPVQYAPVQTPTVAAAPVFTAAETTTQPSATPISTMMVIGGALAALVLVGIGIMTFVRRNK
jgi:PKD repeat protein